MKGVVSGVRDYGNRMGIPTVNGAIYFDDRYMANPLVFCGNIGIMDKNKCFKHPQTGNLVIVVGGRTGTRRNSRRDFFERGNDARARNDFLTRRANR